MLEDGLIIPSPYQGSDFKVTRIDIHVTFTPEMCVVQVMIMLLELSGAGLLLGPKSSALIDCT